MSELVKIPVKTPYLTLIEHRLTELLALPSESTLTKAARWVTLNGGKRLRPLLLIAAVEALNGAVELALTPACALEMIHTYSLIHDDLPSMDNDDYRRGKLTLHKKYNEATAVLTGDFLLTYAFEVLAKAPGLSPKQSLELIQTVAFRSGGEGMILGQLLDLEAEGVKVTLEQLKTIHRKKSAELLTASLEMGGIIADASPEMMGELRSLGDEIGLAFQIIDDVIDVTASVEKHGKLVSSDALNGKTTYVSLLGLEEAKKGAYALLESSLRRLDSFPHSDRLKEIAISLVKREG
jgi:geranylgeranyl diphosphate synthase, type II